MSLELPKETYSNLLSTWPIARLATVSSDEQPHCVPIVFCGHGGFVYSPLDGKRKRGTRLKRFANLADNPKATLLLDEYSSDWQTLWWVRIDGEAELNKPVVDDADAIARLLLDKYPQYRDSSLMFDSTVYLRLRPEKVTMWTQSNAVATINAALRRSPQALQ